MKIVEHILPPQFIESLGWTILHSLWQGAILAILLTLAWIFLRKNSSELRYFVATTALFTLFMVSVLTFLSLYFSYTEPPISPELSYQEIIWIAEHMPAAEVEANSPSALLGFQRYFAEHLPLIVSVWFLGVVVLMLRFLGGIAYLQRLKHYKVVPASSHWEGTLRYLSTQIRVSQPVRLLESAMIQTPMVIGYLKPVILLPLGALSGLPLAQIESILAHELAHIRRHDYLVNLLQSLVDITLFFNPFAWWISACVREERENCCDDIAVQATGDSLTFIKTLANLEALRLDSPQLAVAFIGNKGSLKSRVQRLIYGKNQKATFSEGFLSALVLFFCMGIASYQAQADYQPEQQVASVLSMPFEEVEEIKPSESKKIASKEEITPLDTIRFGDNFMLITSPNGKVEIYQGEKKIEEEEYDKFSNLFKVKDKQVELTSEALGNKGLQIKIDDKVKRLGRGTWKGTDVDVDFEFGEIEEPFPPVNYDFIIGPVITTKTKVRFKQDANNNFFYVKRDLEELNQEIEILQEEVEQHQKNLKKTGKKAEQDAQNKVREKRIEELSRQIDEKARQMEQQSERQEGWAERQEEYAKRQEEYAKRQAEYAERQFEYAMRQEEYAKRQTEWAKETEEVFKKLAKELVKDGLMKDEKDSIKISYNSNDLIINGKTLEGKQKEKYEELLKEGLDMKINIRGDSISIERLNKEKKK
jgi:beta-lactamase regulating signal transducer with metallopeptidase domain